jgi:hypothetical protein
MSNAMLQKAQQYKSRDALVSMPTFIVGMRRNRRCSLFQKLVHQIVSSVFFIDPLPFLHKSVRGQWSKIRICWGFCHFDEGEIWRAMYKGLANAALSSG